MIKSSRGKYKTIRVGSICNDDSKYKCSVSESLTFTSSARKTIILCGGKYKERLGSKKCSVLEVHTVTMRSTNV
jgi:hypothetical protein